MTGNQVVSTMFDVKTSIHMVRTVSVENWNEYSNYLGFITMITYTHATFGD